MHGRAPQPSSPECTDMEIAAAVEATAGARVDWAAFVATRRWSARSLEEFWCHGVAPGNVGRRRTRRNGCKVVAAVCDAKQRFEKLGKKMGCVGVFLDCYDALWLERLRRRMVGSRRRGWVCSRPSVWNVGVYVNVCPPRVRRVCGVIKRSLNCVLESSEGGRVCE